MRFSFLFLKKFSFTETSVFFFFEIAAAVAYGPGEPLVVEEILVHPPKSMEVRIKILFTSICHTDLSAWKGEV